MASIPTRNATGSSKSGKSSHSLPSSTITHCASLPPPLVGWPLLGSPLDSTCGLDGTGPLGPLVPPLVPWLLPSLLPPLDDEAGGCGSLGPSLSPLLPSLLP